MTFPQDMPATVSRDLSVIIQAELDKEHSDEPAMLGYVLEKMYDGLVEELIEQGRLDPAVRDEVFAEMKDLVERYGGDVLAIDFMKYRSSDNLATVIQVELDYRDSDQPPTLGTVLESITSGRVAQLVASGDIDIDDDDTVISEVQSLILQHGENAPAEEFLP
jgi:hypothetical protein